MQTADKFGQSAVWQSVKSIVNATGNCDWGLYTLSPFNIVEEGNMVLSRCLSRAEGGNAESLRIH